MDILTIAVMLFGLLEVSNVFMLYCMPETKKGNGVGVFNAFEKSKEYPEIHIFIKYLINWIAGTKIIFILLLFVIFLTGNDITKICSTIALIASILTFYWRLFPLIIAMDKDGQITPKGYSKTLGIMIFSFIIVLSVAVVLFIMLKK